MDLPIRKSNRLSDFSYSQHGCFFLTICTNNRKPVLSSISEGSVFEPPAVLLTEYGKLVEQQILSMQAFYSDICIDNYVIMPNHVHLLISIISPLFSEKNPANQRIPFLISTLKRFTNKAAGTNLWQRSYHDHVVRDLQDFQNRWTYIDNNPAKWLLDRYYVP